MDALLLSRMEASLMGPSIVKRIIKSLPNAQAKSFVQNDI
jgi:hypothetical protein